METDRGLLQILNVDELAQLELQRRKEQQDYEEAASMDSEANKPDLVAHVWRQWSEAKRAKEPIEQDMIVALRQRKGEYDPQKLAEIRAVKQPEIFLNITDTKCRNGIAWVKDIMIQPGQRIFAVDPTPLPELPEHIKAQIQGSVLSQYLDAAVSMAQSTGMPLTTEMLREIVVQKSGEIEQRVHESIVRKAKLMADDLTDRIDDDFTQGGFYKALEAAIDDIVVLKAGILKGPIFRRDKVRKVKLGNTGILVPYIEEKIVPQYDRRSPFSIYPSPKSTGVNDGYLFDVILLQPRQLHGLIGAPGFNEKEIRAVLQEFEGRQLKNDWLSLSMDAKEGIGEEGETADSSSPAEKIYCLELWDEIPGSLLQEWGMDAGEVPDGEECYSSCIWMIGDHIIKAMLNGDLLSRKPFHKASLEEINDAFWGTGLCEIIAPEQQVCNAAARAILSNIGFGSGPMVDLNIDRLEPGASRDIWPLRVFPTTDEQMGTNAARAVNFYQPQMVTAQLIQVMEAFSRKADEHSGVPAYAHGDSAVGGAGSTSSGLAQLINMAARGIKAVVRNIDFHIIVPCLEQHYDYLLENSNIFGLVGDYKISAKGTAALLAKEQQASRKIEYMNYTGNPIDIQILGLENRRKLLLTLAKDLGIDLDNPPVSVFGNNQQQQPMNPQQMPPQQAQTPLDPAGNPVVGMDNRQFNPERPRLEPSTPGNAGGANLNA